jgi:hypothetical protein
VAGFGQGSAEADMVVNESSSVAEASTDWQISSVLIVQKILN